MQETMNDMQKTIDELNQDLDTQSIELSKAENEL